MADEPPTIHYAAAIGPDGEVYRGPECTKAEAIAWRRLGRDVVVCGDSLAANQDLAWEIEEAAAGAGNVKQHAAHTRLAGPRALPHLQPRVRPPEGHTFFETRWQRSEP